MHKTLFETLLAAAVTWPFRPDPSRLLLPNAKEPLDAQAELRAAVTKTVETFGPLDIFVSNAGISHDGHNRHLQSRRLRPHGGHQCRGASLVMGLHRQIQVRRPLRLAIYRQLGCSFRRVTLKQACVGDGQCHPNSMPFSQQQGRGID